MIHHKDYTQQSFYMHHRSTRRAYTMMICPHCGDMARYDGQQPHCWHCGDIDQTVIVAISDQPAIRKMIADCQPRNVEIYLNPPALRTPAELELVGV